MGYPFYYWRNYLMMNQGKEVFYDRALELGIEPPLAGRYLPDMIDGTKCPRSSRCAATGDFDGDGRLEIVTNNFNDAPYFFKNELPQNNYLALDLRGTNSNRDGIGALVRLKVGEQTMIRQLHGSSGYLSNSSKRLHFGLGAQTTIDALEILWPSGTRQIVKSPQVNRRHQIVEPPAALGRSDGRPGEDPAPQRTARGGLVVTE
jgi:hypothetical protein